MRNIAILISAILLPSCGSQMQEMRSGITATILASREWCNVHAIMPLVDSPDDCIFVSTEFGRSVPRDTPVFERVEVVPFSSLAGELQTRPQGTQATWIFVCLPDGDNTEFIARCMRFEVEVHAKMTHPVFTTWVGCRNRIAEFLATDDRIREIRDGKFPSIDWPVRPGRKP